MLHVFAAGIVCFTRRKHRPKFAARYALYNLALIGYAFLHYECAYLLGQLGRHERAERLVHIRFRLLKIERVAECRYTQGVCKHTQQRDSSKQYILRNIRA